MPSSVNLARFNRAFERFFNIKGGPTVFDVNAQLAMEYSLPLSLEERTLFDISSYGVTSSQGGVAGNKSASMLLNPVGSGVVATIEKLSATPGVAANVSLFVAGQPNAVSLLTPDTGQARVDPRQRTSSSVKVSHDAPVTDPATGFLALQLYICVATSQNDFILTSNQEIVLLPGIGIRAVCQTVNTTLFVNWMWRERPLEQSELT